MTDSLYMASMQGDDTTLSNGDILVAYEQGIQALRASVEGMTREQILARPIPGKWSSQEVVSHVADTEIYFSDRIERTVVLDRPLLLDVDERPYMQKLRYQEFDLAEQLDLFTALRRHIVRILKVQPAEAWQRTAIHTGTGLVTLRQLVLQSVRHARHHLPFIAEKRAALAKGR